MVRARVFSGVVAALVSAAVGFQGDHDIRIIACSSKAKMGNQETANFQDGKEVKCGSSAEDRFAPKFDGLRFVETLVTAHR